MKKVVVNVFLSVWICAVISLYLLVALLPKYHEIVYSYSWAANMRATAMTWFYRDYIF